MVLLSDKIAVVFYSEQLLCYTACGGEKMSTDDKFEHLVDEPECMQKIREQEEKLRKMVEPPAGIKKLMENEARIADMASAATRLSSMNLPSLDVPYMAGAMEMAHAMSQLPKPAIAPHIPQIMKEISDRMDAIVAPARESQALLKGMEAVQKWDLPTFTKPELMGFLEASKYFDVIPHAALDWSSWTTPLSEVLGGYPIAQRHSPLMVCLRSCRRQSIPISIGRDRSGRNEFSLRLSVLPAGFRILGEQRSFLDSLVSTRFWPRVQTSKNG